MAAAEIILALFHGPPLYQIDGPANNGLKFFLHGDEVKETPVGVGGKGHENIDIAFRAKVVTQT